MSSDFLLDCCYKYTISKLIVSCSYISLEQKTKYGMVKKIKTEKIEIEKIEIENIETEKITGLVSSSMAVS